MRKAMVVVVVITLLIDAMMIGTAIVKEVENVTKTSEGIQINLKSGNGYWIEL
ncbi:MAG: hypothetical protein RR744_07940 [Cellulosilyticaceae bacterium]